MLPPVAICFFRQTCLHSHDTLSGGVATYCLLLSPLTHIIDPLSSYTFSVGALLWAYYSLNLYSRKMSSLFKIIINICLGLTVVITQYAIPYFDLFVSTDVFTFT